jgi:hypothetical protein
VLQAISTPDLGSYPREAIREYQTAWDEALETGEPPYAGVASLLFDKLGCANAIEVAGQTLKDPLLLMALSEKIVTFCSGWWKGLIGSRKLVQ